MTKEGFVFVVCGVLYVMYGIIGLVGWKLANEEDATVSWQDFGQMLFIGAVILFATQTTVLAIVIGFQVYNSLPSAFSTPIPR